MKRKSAIKVLSLVLSIAVLCGSVGVMASGGVRLSLPEASPAASNRAAVSAGEADSLRKEETVYVLADASGSVRKVIVSDRIENALRSKSVSDYSELENIVNLKGDGQYTRDGKLCIWDAQGNDIYYQGTIEKELPVSVDVKYFLDGRELSAEEIAGKSGRVTIRFAYTNRQRETVVLNGETTELYVPFAVMTGTVLENEFFRNIEVSNGKIINDGDRTLVAGIAFPGLSENLALSPETLEIPDFVEISADVSSFHSGTVYTLVTNEIFNRIDLRDAEESSAELTGALSELQNAVMQLMDGSSALYDGLTLLSDQSGALVQGVERLKNGAAQLQTGANSLKDGSAELHAGAQALASGLSTLSSKNTELTGAAKQIFVSLLAAADGQIAAAGLSADSLTTENYGRVLDSLIASLQEDAVRETATREARKQTETAVRAQTAVIQNQVTQAVRVSVLERILSESGFSMSAAAYESAVQAGQISEQVQAGVSAALERQMQSEAVLRMISEQTELQVQKLIAQTMESEAVTAKINAAVQKAAEGAASLKSLKTQLNGYSEFYSGLLAYTGGVAEAGSGASSLRDGAYALTAGSQALSSGVQELYEGILELQKGSDALIGGIAQLKDGALQLSDGMRAFCEDGVERLIGAAEGELAGLTERIRAMTELSCSYRSFSGIAEEMTGSVRFVYKTDGVK